MPYTEEEAKVVGTAIGIDWEDVDFEPRTLAVGMDVEMEHGSALGPQVNVTDDDPKATAKIAWAHLMESPHYYEALAQMEVQLETPTEARVAKRLVHAATYNEAYMKVRQPGQKGVDRTIGSGLKKLIDAYLQKITEAVEGGKSVDKAFKEIRPDLNNMKATDLISLLWENESVGARPLSVLKAGIDVFDFYHGLQTLFEMVIRETAMQWWSSLPTKRKKKPETRDNKETVVTKDDSDTVPDEDGTKVETPKGKRTQGFVTFRGRKYQEL